MWTDERVELLKKLWAEGLSASQIAARLGGTTRNAVIGKVHRLNLPGRVTVVRKFSMRCPKPSRAKSQRRAHKFSFGAAVLPPTPEGPEPVATAQPPLAALGAPDSPPITILELKPRSCRWPIDDDPKRPDFHYCGAEAIEGKSYCLYHELIARLKSSAAQIRRAA